MPPSNYTINASVTNQSYKAGLASTNVTVNDVAPQFTAADLSLSKTIANEGDTITLNGQFTDPDTLGSYTVTIDWGDGSTPTVAPRALGQVVPSTTTPGLYTYSTTHQYLNNPPGEPTGGSYDIHVSVSDGVSTTSADTSIVVNNVRRPSVRDPSSPVRASDVHRDDHRDGQCDRPGHSRHGDRGLDDYPERDRDPTRPRARASRSRSPTRSASLVATATATDSDGGAGSRQRADGDHLPGQCVGRDQPERDHRLDGRDPISTTTLAGARPGRRADHGSNDIVDASADDEPGRARQLRVQRDAARRLGQRPARGRPGGQQPGRRRRQRYARLQQGRRHARRRRGQRCLPDQPRPRPARDRWQRVQHARLLDRHAWGSP